MRSIRRSLLPAAVFLATLAFHVAWLRVFPERAEAQSRWAAAPQAKLTLRGYVDSGSFWLGLSYAMSLAFAAFAFRRFRENRARASAGAAAGSLTLGAFLSVAGCFLVGCCGSPMLPIYLNLFGAGFLKIARPLVAVLTAVSLGLTWLWMNRRRASPGAAGAACCCGPGDCCGDAAKVSQEAGLLGKRSR